VLLFSMVAHEYAHAEAAYRQGDDTAYMLGRLTLNPLKHIDPIMTVLVPLVLWLSHAGFLFGAAKPVPVTITMLLPAAGPKAGTTRATVGVWPKAGPERSRKAAAASRLFPGSRRWMRLERNALVVCM